LPIALQQFADRSELLEDIGDGEQQPDGLISMNDWLCLHSKSIATADEPR
jgi:hypothetical protein